MPNALDLKNASATAGFFKDQLLAVYPELADDERTFLDTLDGLTDLSEIVALFVKSADDDIALADGCKARIAEIGERKARFMARADTKKRLVLEALERAGIKKIERSEFTVSIRAVPPSVVIENDALLPVNFVRTTVTTAPDKAAIKEALTSGNDVPGAKLSNGGVTLAIRRN